MNPTYMELAISLAKKGEGRVNPNPLVGAVIVKDERVIGQGFHRQYGGLHAEREAFNSLTEDCRGADLYVTLEPCCHHGKQPPCTEAIIEHGIKRVYIGSSDPNPLVAGRGVQILQAHGIEVTEHVLEEACDRLNPVFFHYIRTQTPFTALKYAMTADGKTAARTGLSKWITSEKARQHVQCLRNRYTGIMVGIGTVLQDNPLLNCRMEHGRNPIRIICDSHLRIPLDSQIVKTAAEIPTFIAALETADSQKARTLTQEGLTVLSLPEHNGHLSLPLLMQELGRRQIDGILLEGGGTLAESMLRENLVQHVYAYIAPKLFGGPGRYTPVSGTGIAEPDEAWQLELEEILPLGADLLLSYDVKQNP
ncbi:MAG: bifunctional diaminohydroxyphosphoribosylaminopyrimidine deaminase/5-amino-6-(5-phosphoribosylamino)uracil reductase RibD [Lachnospiraceae bacterium]|nr:bifunctional diaminohydroxyphosphoribosylaminopyrimidine deaminase/5-amino-6-(5-phosphoribosylamino)uracil reductase RibD [Lachnospiraceae bacterium]